MEKEKERLRIINKCPECGSSHIEKDQARAERVCQNCGLVVENGFIDQGSDWRAFDKEQQDKRAHTGPPSTPRMYDKNLSTEIDWRDRDSSGQLIPARTRQQLHRIRKWHKRIGASKRNLAIALRGVDRMSSSMGFPRTVRETAAIIYRKAAAQGLVRGRSIEGVVAATLYAACRECGFPRTLNEIVAVAQNVPKKEIGRNYRFLKKELRLKEGYSSSKAYIPRFCSELKFPNLEVQNKAFEIAKESEEKRLNEGASPPGTAAAVIYIANMLLLSKEERKTQRDIAQVAGVTEVTVRNRYKALVRELDIHISS